MSSEHWPTYLILAIYVLVTAGVTLAARRKNKDPNDDSSHVTRHFLGSKNFGPILLTLTTFASCFSGYTVVGLPNDSAKRGFIAIRWWGIGETVSMLIVYPRLRRLSIVRDHESPGDFIRDRYKSPAMSILVAILLCLPQIIYIGTNIFSVGSILESLTDGELNFYWVIVFATIIMLVFEALGGMRSVAYTDAVEAIVMVSIFLTVPAMLGIYYGGFAGQVNNSEDLTIPCHNSNANDTNGCLNYAVYELDSEKPGSAEFGMVSSTMPFAMNELSEYFLRSPSMLTILNHVLFCIGDLSFALNPHVCQRALTAKRDADLRIAMMALFVAGFLYVMSNHVITQIPGILTGITAISNQWEGEAFSAVLANFEERGGFAAFVANVGLLAGVAGIMSTADSALIGVSNTISVDIFRNHVFTNFTSAQIVYVGKAVSLVTMSLCFGFACLVYNSDQDYASVNAIQKGLLWQAVPAYLFGLYTNLSSKAVLTGTSSGVICCMILISVLYSNDGTNDPLPMVDKSWLTLTSVAVNVIVSLFAHLVISKIIKRTSESQDILSISDIRNIMDGIREPVTRWGGILVWLSFIVSLMIVFHWMGEIDPYLVEEYGEEYANDMMYNGEIRNVIGGVPDWFLSSVLLYAVAAILGIVAALQWDVDSELISAHIPAESMEQAADGTKGDIKYAGQTEMIDITVDH